MEVRGHRDRVPGQRGLRDTEPVRRGARGAGLGRARHGKGGFGAAHFGRGGVHFLLQVDMKAAANKSAERYLGDARGLLRDKKIYYSGIGREGERITVRFREADQKAAALKALTESMSDLTIRERDVGGES